MVLSLSSSDLVKSTCSLSAVVGASVMSCEGALIDVVGLFLLAGREIWRFAVVLLCVAISLTGGTMGSKSSMSVYSSPLLTNPPSAERTGRSWFGWDFLWLCKILGVFWLKSLAIASKK